ncbi:MAG: UDP-N-acetylglucosamine 1-carboxyvinyltransferase [Clostridia bacterium]|nr:UDP-N-acetylglucosamine 1-carboxyvinyltransferase [Clostridia bacterium]
MGPRPIDLHLSSLRELGYTLRDEGGRIDCAGTGIAREIHLSFPSVGATENLLLAATGIPGVTRIINAAREPEIEDLVGFLRSAGANITGEGSSVLHIEGGKPLRPAEYTVMPDRIAGATYACAVASAGGELMLRQVVPSHFSAVTALLEAAGCRVITEENRLYISRKGELSPFYSVKTMPYPGFPTDAQAILMATAIRGKGVSAFTETIFESRFRHVSELRRMGADIRLFGKSALVFGKETIRGARVAAHDLRCGAALMVAALGAEGETHMDNMQYVARGYDDLVTHLNRAGANITML